MKRIGKLSLISTLTTISVSILVSRLHESLFQGIFFGGLLFVFLFSIIIFSQDENDLNDAIFSLLLSIVIFSMFLRVYQFQFAPSLVGVDPDNYAVWISEILSKGEVTPKFPFYSEAPIMLIFSVIGLAILDTSKSGLGIYPVLLGVFVPLASAAIAKSAVYTARVRVLLISSVLGTVTTHTILRGFWPIAQSHSIVLFLTTIIVIQMFVTQHRKKHLVLFFMLLVASLYTHKMPVLFISSILVIQYLLVSTFNNFNIPNMNVKNVYLQHFSINLSTSGILLIWVAWLGAGFIFVHSSVLVIGSAFTIYFVWVLRHKVLSDGKNESRLRPSSLLLVISIIMVLVQFVFVTDFINGVVFGQIVPLLTRSTFVSSGSNLPLSGAVRTSEAIYEPFLHFSNLFILLLFSSYSALYLVLSRKINHQTTTILSITVLAFLLIPVSLTAGGDSGVGANRLFAPFEVVLVALISIWIGEVLEYMGKKDLNVKLVLVILLTVIGIFQLGAPGATPDHPTEPRQYLSDSEISSKEFSNEYVSGIVYTDDYLAEENLTYLNNNSVTNRPRYVGRSEGILSESLDEEYEGVVIYREEYTYGQWKLTWNPKNAFSVKMNNIFENGRSNVFVATSH